MPLFARQPVHCPSCGALHDAQLDRAPLGSVPGIELCCDEDCRQALRLAHTRYVMGKKAPHAENPIREAILSKEAPMPVR